MHVSVLCSVAPERTVLTSGFPFINALTAEGRLTLGAFLWLQNNFLANIAGEVILHAVHELLGLGWEYLAGLFELSRLGNIAGRQLLQINVLLDLIIKLLKKCICIGTQCLERQHLCR